MNSNNFYTRKKFGLDNRVWYVMLTVIVVSIGLLSYQLADTKKCVPIHFTFRRLLAAESDTAVSVFHVGETIMFSASKNPDIISWDFDDNSGVQYGQFINHEFKMERDYYVTARVGRGCNDVQKISIIKAAEAASAPSSDQIITGGDSTVYPNIRQTYTCMQPADYYDWNLDGYPAMRQQGVAASAKFTFPKPGTYTIRVTLNHDVSKQYPRIVIVSEEIRPAPPAFVPDTAKPSSITNDQTSNTPIINDQAKAEFENMVKQVVGGADIQTLNFNKYLCYHIDKTKATLKQTDKAALGSRISDKTDYFNLLCLQMPNMKTRKSSFGKKSKIEVKKVELKVNPDDGCVTLIVIEYE